MRKDLRVVCMHVVLCSSCMCAILTFLASTTPPRRCDVAVTADTTATLSTLSAPLTGLLHAGGILADAPLQQQTAAGIRCVHAPKVAGALRLLAAAGGPAGQPLCQLVLFSSIAALTGPAGSTNYAAANASLDALAAYLRQQGTAGASVQWGAWSGVGMVSHNTAVQVRVRGWFIYVMCPWS